VVTAEFDNSTQQFTITFDQATGQIEGMDFGPAVEDGVMLRCPRLIKPQGRRQDGWRSLAMTFGALVYRRAQSGLCRGDLMSSIIASGCQGLGDRAPGWVVVGVV
jgi:hypothetical protein